MKKHLIATWLRECDEEPFARVFSAYPDLGLWNARTEQGEPPSPAGLLLTGGSDIAVPFLRQEVPDPKLVEEPDLARDTWEFAAAAKALTARLPILAICRGHQVLNVALGGTLRLDLPHHRDPEQKHGNLQPVRYAEGVPEAIRFPRVNSSHHQAVDRPGAGLVPEGWHAVDGVVELMRLHDYPFALGVQYHPERDPLYQPLFDAFVAKVREFTPLKKE